MELEYETFAVCYNTQRKIPNWTFECITKSSTEINDECSRKRFRFKQDNRVDVLFRSRNDDYRNSGYDHGHMAAARNHQNPPWCQQTFHFTNAAPQLPEFNAGVWKTLETYARSLTEEYPRVYVFSGTLFLSETDEDKSFIKHEVIGDGEVHVPTHFFKIITKELQSGEFEDECYVIPHQIFGKMSLKKIMADFENEIDFVNKKGGFIFSDIFNKFSDKYKYD